MPTMKIWGMISADDAKAGFDLVLDKDWYVLLVKGDKTIARFDPRDYTSTELYDEVAARIRSGQNDSSAE